MDVLYAKSYRCEEWDAKNMDCRDGAQAIGVDASRALPGLYWLNYFSPIYCGLIGRDRLLTAPAFETRGIGEGVLVMLDEEPEDWGTPGSRYPQVLDHIGDEYFFLRDKLERETRAPDFGLAPLTPHPRFRW